MKCLECGQEKRTVNNTHLLSCCGLTIKQYREKYPFAEWIDPDVRKLYGQPGKKNPNYKTGRCIRNCSSCGVRINQGTKGILCKKCHTLHGGFLGDKNPFYGKEHTTEVKQKMSIAQQKRDPSTRTHVPLSAEARRIIGEKSRLRWKNMSEKEKSERMRNFITAGQKANKKSSKTKIEEIVAKIIPLAERNVFIKTANSTYNVDFVVGKRGIECYGDYWHCNPRFYKQDFYNKSLHMTAKQKWDKDSDRLDRIREVGYTILVIWGYEIRFDLAETERRIREFLC